MADVILEITISDAKVTKASEGFLSIYPNIEEDEQGEAKYTTKEWVEEKLLRILKRDVHRGLQMKANQEARIEFDDDIATRT